ncbi:MAG: prepilin-type N-terminal cleavage/methylation domain-containing protein [Clostridiales Family XIII bacterium]|jgi:prepilin-type N-terminal cleavage/methylation domain-containing protein|nr:prepilin-type N-terminal cleavage/methylation domain-containing protein [Clostridiales Family XIII bacterium]
MKNTVNKKPQAHGALKIRNKAGFTLVEVIVVLVILAILAAIAIPALTGYIDKARIRTSVSNAKAVQTGLQTLIALQYGDGNQTPQAGGEYFTGTRSLAAAGTENDIIKTKYNHIFYGGLTEKGAKELAALTGIPYESFDDWTPDSSDFSICNPWAISIFGGSDTYNPAEEITVSYFVYHDAGNMVIYDPDASWYDAIKGSGSFPNINKTLGRSGAFSVCTFEAYDADVGVSK